MLSGFISQSKIISNLFELLFGVLPGLPYWQISHLCSFSQIDPNVSKIWINNIGMQHFTVFRRHLNSSMLSTVTDVHSVWDQLKALFRISQQVDRKDVYNNSNNNNKNNGDTFEVDRLTAEDIDLWVPESIVQPDHWFRAHSIPYQLLPVEWHPFDEL